MRVACRLVSASRVARVIGAVLAAGVISAGAASAGGPPPSIVSVGIANGSTLTGSIVWTAQVNGTVNRVDFSIDGAVRSTASSSPYTFGNSLDTTSLGNGSHTFTVTAYPNPGKGNGVSASVTATVANAAPTPPPPPPPPPSPTAPVSTSSPTVSGSAVVGQLLSASTGSWSGTTPMSYGYQWQQCNTSGGSCTPIAGATSATVAVPSTAAGATIRVTVTASNTAGSAAATSAVTAVVTAPAPTLPVATALPAVAGSPVVGQVLTGSPGSWAGTAPIAFKYQWQQCSSTATTCTSISGATAGTFSVTSTLAGSTVRVVVTATNAAGSTTAQSAVTAVVTAAPTASVSQFDSKTAYLDSPLPSLANAVTVSSASAFATAIAKAQAGQTINVLGNVQIPGEFTGFNRVISGGTVNVVFQPGAAFTGMAGTNLPAVWIRNSGGWRIWGGTITNPEGSGILMYAMPGPFVWTGFAVSNTANTCVSVFPIGGNVNGVVLKGVAGTATANLALDPHAEKGTGIHAWNIADGGSTAGLVQNSTFATDTVDEATGAAVEVQAGHIGANVVLYARARHVGFPIPGTTWLGYATQQTAGNVLQLWGASLPGSLDVRYLEGNDIQGRILQTGGMNSGASLANATVDEGMATGPILLNPTISRIAYDVRDGIRLSDVSPLP